MAILRTTEEAVSAIVDADSTIDLAPFLEAANFLVTKHCSPAGAGYEELELVERWLAAHFYRIRDPKASSEKAGSVAANYMHQVDLGLDQTQEGQMAKVFDSSGKLAQLDQQTKDGKSRKASITWLGVEG
jgi:hypothetical protein